jgi:hypothetical protein
VCCRRARFPGGVQFRLRWAHVVLDDTDLAAPSILAGIPRLSIPVFARKEEQVTRDWQELLAAEIPGRPQLLSVRRANVAGLGHAEIGVTMNTYAHVLPVLRQEATDAIDELFGT